MLKFHVAIQPGSALESIVSYNESDGSIQMNQEGMHLGSNAPKILAIGH
jgi:hypothetical protein